MASERDPPSCIRKRGRNTRRRAKAEAAALPTQRWRPKRGRYRAHLCREEAPHTEGGQRRRTQSGEEVGGDGDAAAVSTSGVARAMDINNIHTSLAHANERIAQNTAKQWGAGRRDPQGTAIRALRQ